MSVSWLGPFTTYMTFPCILTLQICIHDSDLCFRKIASFKCLDLWELFKPSQLLIFLVLKLHVRDQCYYKEIMKFVLWLLENCINLRCKFNNSCNDILGHLSFTTEVLIYLLKINAMALCWSYLYSWVLQQLLLLNRDEYKIFQISQGITLIFISSPQVKEFLSTLWFCWRLQAAKWFQILQLCVSS